MLPSVNFGGTIHLTGAPQTGFLSCAWVRGGTATKRTETTRNSRQYRFTEFVIENSSCSAPCCLIFFSTLLFASIPRPAHWVQAREAFLQAWQSGKCGMWFRLIPIRHRKIIVG